MAHQLNKRRENSSTGTCGYIIFVISNIFIITYMLWVFLPDYIVESITDEPYRYYYTARESAGYIPAYLALLFVFIPVLYMGLNIVYHDSDNIKW